MNKCRLIMLNLLIFTFVLPNYGADYYWIGGTGNWSEISHWATSSGGAITYAQTPTAADNVIFDTNSFTAANQVVTINDDNVFSRNLTIRNVTNNPRFDGAINSKLNVFGSVDIAETCVWDFKGRIVFQGSSTGMTINFSNKRAGDNVNFMGPGSWVVNSPLIVASTLSVFEGNIDFGSQRIECQFFRSTGSARRNINFNNSTWLISGLSNIMDEFWDENPLNIWSAYLETTNLSTTSNTAKIEFNTIKSNFYIKGTNQQLDLPSLFYSSNLGRSSIKNFRNGVKITIKGDLEANHALFINSGLELKNFILKPGVNLGLLSGASFKFDRLIGDGTCSKYITLLSFPNNDLVNFESSGSSTIAFYQINNIKLSGNATANNSIKLGNSSGWTINEKASQNFFWVGRNGNWSNPNNWSLTSGGAAAGCLPSAVDNVFFDNNSFNAGNQFVMVDQEDVYCKDYKWMNIPSNTGINGDLTKRIQVYGSLEFSPNTKHDFDGEYLFLGSGENTITSRGKFFPRDVYFNNGQGTWIFKDNFQNERRVLFTNGKLVFDNVVATFNRFLSEVNNSRQIELKNSLILFKFFHNWHPYAYINPEKLILDAGMSEVKFTGTSFGNLSINGNEKIKFHKLTFDVSDGNLSNWTSQDKSLIEASHLVFRGSGYMNINGKFDTLTLTHGNDYELTSETKIELNKLIHNDQCKGFVSINMNVFNFNNKNPNIKINNNESYTKFSIKDIHVTSNAPVRLINSLDRGGNLGFVFEGNTQGRTLYFVAKNEFWNDTQNWSLSSGGIGGECLPTEIDDVIFDNNSRLSMFSFLTTGPNSISNFCKDFLFNVDNFNGYINLNELFVHGDFKVLKKINSFTTNVYFTGPKDSIQRVNVLENFKFWYNIKRSGSILELETPIKLVGWLQLLEGEFNTNNHNIETDHSIYIGKQNEVLKPKVNFGSSKIYVNGEYSYFNNTFYITTHAVVNGLESEIYLTNQTTGLTNYSPDTKLGKVEATSIVGITFITAEKSELYIKNLTLRGDGDIKYKFEFSNAIGKIKSDTVILTAGKSYTFENISQYEITKYLQARGNNCRPISISSSSTGSKATINMPTSAKINMDFAQLRDMQGIGGADFNAGPYSTNINNSNVGWIFPQPNTLSEIVGFLGPDQILCPSQNTLSLDANSYTPDEKYLWSNGSTNPQLNVSASGLYHVRVTFGATCVTSDTIRISLGSDIKDYLPNDTILCNSPSLILKSKINDSKFKYLWSNGSTAQDLSVNTSGLYKLSLQNENCTFQDSVNISFLRVDDVNLPAQITLCSGDSIVLNAGNNYDRWRWQNGASTNTFIAKNQGLYWVEITKGPCIVFDSTNVTVTPRPIFNLGRDTSFCEGNLLNLSTGSPDVVRWQDNSTNPNFTVRSSGMYFATKGSGNCTFRDTINVVVNPIPLVNLGSDITLCNQESTRLNAQGPNLRYLWSTGSTNPEINVNAANSYQVTVTNITTNCQNRDTVVVSVINIVKPNLGSDTRICANNSSTLSITPQVNTRTLWSTGVNTNSISVNTSGTYWVEISQANCKERDSINIVVLPRPTITSPSTITICEQGTSEVTLTGTFDNILWSSGQTQPKLPVNQPGRYTYRVSRDICTLDSAVNVTIVNIPIPDLGENLELCQGERATLTAPDFNGTTTWSTGSNAKSINVRNGGTYTLSLSASGCTKIDSVRINLINCDGDIVYFPNIIAPNKISIDNQFFRGVLDQNYNLTNFELQVYDRQGNMVFSTTDINLTWDGSLNGATLQEGVFTYKCKVSAEGRKKIEDKIIAGAVIVVR